MSAPSGKNNENGVDLESYLVTKHSAWKGKYKRILTIGTHGISTYNPDKFDLTNRWPYSDVVSVAPSRTGNNTNEFVITLKKEKKLDTLRFSCEHKNDVLTALLKFHKEFAERPRQSQRFNAKKYHWSGVKLPVTLEVTPCSLDQLDPATNTIFASYNFKEIDGIIGIQDVEGGIVLAYGGFSRLHLFMALNHHEIIQSIVQQCSQSLGVDIKVLPTQITLNQFIKERFGEYQSDQHQTSLSEFVVKKISPRHIEPPKRIFCLTDSTLVERDPQTYNICTLRPLKEIFSLIRSPTNLQMFGVEYKNGDIRTYTTNDRDSLLATLLDAVRSTGNKDVHIKSSTAERGKRVVPLYTSVDEETEANLLRFIMNFYQYPVKRAEVLERFNANIPYSGLNYSVSQDTLFAENKERLISTALQALSAKETDPNAPQLTNQELEASFHVLRRLLASKVGFAAFTNLNGFREAMGTRVVHSLKRNDLAVTYGAIDMINSLMHSMHGEYDLKQEQMNKNSLLTSKAFLESLLDMWVSHIALGSGALVLSAMLDFLTFALCVPYSETTDGKQFDVLLEMVAARGRYVYKLYQHPSLAIVKGAGLIMKALIEEGDANVAKQMQVLALDEAALCRHMLIALYTPSNDTTMETHRQISKHLINLWVHESDDALALFARIFPAGLLMFLESSEAVPRGEEEQDKVNFRDNLKLATQHPSNKNIRLNYLIEKHLEGIKHWGIALLDQDRAAQLQQQQSMKPQNRPVVLRNRRQRKKKSDAAAFNLPLFFYNFHQNHNLPNLIWNHKTREELRTALENELRQFQSDKDLSGNLLVAWNFEEFEVKYNCLADEIKIGDFYIRLLLENDDWPHNLIKNPTELFNAIYRKVLARNRVNDDQMTVVALQALSKVYQKHHEEIGYFSDITYILLMLDKCVSPALRDALIGFLKCLVSHKANCRPLLEHISCLIDLITLSHLHTGNVLPNTKTNVIEAGDMKMVEEKDWYYNIEKDKENEKPERCGPVTFSDLKTLYTKGVITPRTRLWAIGMDGWRSLQQIPQLKWTLMAKGGAIFNEIELASEILDILVKCTSFFPSRAHDGEAVLVPGPRISRKLSEFICLPHIVQVCLTHDPRLLERVASLMCQIMQDNPEVTKVYLTGVFYFMLMYMGNNILPIVKFLKMTHMKQAFRSDDSMSTSDIMHRSILGQMLPEAMVCFLENYSSEKFAEIFLGEFDTPEVIWNSEMRRMLIEKISAHIGDFVPRLKGHTMARYPYLAIPIISYPQLERELFCHIYYLRHLCDTSKFPNWPIQSPVLLLKHTLDAWRQEVEKKPPQMTVKDAYTNLGIDIEKDPQPDEALIRKSYYRLAQKYHPDKNPQGKDIFMRVNQAYEFLCSRTSWATDGPNPHNIFLILKTQSILFDRYAKELRPYKYAGYSQLIATIRLETKDEQLFSKSVPLLNAAAELCYHTVHCSSLNAEELRREGGLEALLEAYSRCVSIMNADSTPEETHYQIISNVTRCFEVSCKFEKCKEKIVELPDLIVDVCRIVYFKHSLSINLVTSLAANNYQLQNELIRNGVLWSLLLFMFDYDYTLEESGVEIEEKSNKQQASNNLAKSSVIACVALAGYTVTFKVDDEKEKIDETENPVVGEIKGKSEPIAPIVVSPTGEGYSSNASNILQNNSSLIAQVVNSNSKEPASPGEDASENAKLVKSFSKYTITDEPQNLVVKSMLDILLTPFIANKLAVDAESEVLKILTQNTRNPYLIWDNSTRAQLLDFLEFQRQNSSKQQHDDITDIYNTTSKFVYDATRDELKIGGVYIRIYNEMPTFPIHDAKMFVLDLLEYLKQADIFINGNNRNNGSSQIIAPAPQHPTVRQLGQMQAPLIPTPAAQPTVKDQKNLDNILNDYNRSKMRNQLGKRNGDDNDTAKISYDFASDAKFVEHLIMTLNSLISVIKQNPNVELQCIGNFDILFGFLNTQLKEHNQKIKTLALEVISLLSRNKDCVTEIAECGILGTFLKTIKDDDFQKQRVLDTLSGLTNAPQLVKEAHAKGVVIYLLDLFCNSNNAQLRETSAELLAKMTSDKLSGPKVRITVCKFLPAVFLDAMIDSPSISAQMLESEHEHPELIWNEKTRERVSSTVRRMADNFYKNQMQDPNYQWKDPDMLAEISTSELVVSGVYLRLYAANPGWTLRRPRQFLSDLLDFIVENANRSGTPKEILDTASTALVGFLNNSPHMADAVPVLGHIPKLFRQLTVQPRSTLTVLHTLSMSEVCVAAIAQTECILALKKCMENERDLVAMCCETLTRLFKCQHESLIRQSLECLLIQFMLGMLKNRANLTGNPATVIAQIVSALKTMAQNLKYGDQVLHVLNSDPIWAEFKDQNHDLFIMDTQKRGMITGGPVNSIAGYLTAAPSKKPEVVMTPPPVDKDDFTGFPTEEP